MILQNWLRRFRAHDPVCRFHPRSWNRVCNVLEDIEGVNCRVEKTESGHGWKIIVGDGSDSELPSGTPSLGLPYPYGPGYNFGIRIEGTSVHIYASTAKRGRTAYYVGADDISITADGDWIVLKMTAGVDEGDDTFEFARYPDGLNPPGDDGAKAVLLLHQFNLFTPEDGPTVVTRRYSAMFDGVFPGMGH